MEITPRKFISTITVLLFVLFRSSVQLSVLSVDVQNYLENTCLKTDQFISPSLLRSQGSSLPQLSKVNVVPFLGCSNETYPPIRNEIDLYVVNLNLPPKQRWLRLTRDKSVHMKRLSLYMRGLLEKLVGKRIFTFLNESLLQLADTLPQPFREEIQGIAEGADVPLSDAVLYNVFYEIFSVCTSIVLEDKQGNIFHGRNLDFGLFLGWDVHNSSWSVTELLRPLAVQLKFEKDGQTLFEAVSFAGFVGVITGMKKDKFSFSLDERFTLNGGFVGLFEWLVFKDYKQKWVSFLAREVLESADSFEAAKVQLSRERILAPVYFIIAGVRSGQGAIITRWRNSFNILELGRTHQDLSVSNAKWFLVETNYDHWVGPPFYDDRRTPAIHCLEVGGQGEASFKLAYDVLSTKPILNKLTTYTSLMSAKDGFLKSWLRECPSPCWPW